MPCVYNIFLILLIFLTAAMPAYASKAAGEIKKGNLLYKKGQFEPASEQYIKAWAKDPQSAAVAYDLGTGLYKNMRYADAIEYLNKALLTDDLLLKTRAHFNLGNAHYKDGVSKEKKDIDQAVAALEKSLDQYQKVLTADPKDNDAQFNHDFVAKELQRLKQKKQDQKDQQNNQQKSGQENRDQNQDDKNQSSGQGQDRDPSQGPNNEQSQSPKGTDPQDKQPKDQGEDQSKDRSNDGSQEGQKENDAPEDQNKDKQSNDQKNDSREPTKSESREQGAEPGAMTAQEADMVLGDYENNEEPKGMLYFVPQSSKEKTVAKDW